MVELKNTWGEVFEVNLEMSDIELDQQYTCNKRTEPTYLNGNTVTVVRKGKKNVFVTTEMYPNEEFAVRPYMLDNLQ